MLQVRTKLMVGLWATVACAFVSHVFLDRGQAFMAQLTLRVEDALEDAGFESVRFAFVGDPVPSRSVRLDGYKSRDPRAIAAVEAVPGIGSVSQMEEWRAEGRRDR